ncbi:MAG TPA: ribonuclease T2 [Steroidobacteraceae bacterium]|nr:ribonuclease T2 [Steroidobacteraceae bacterium]
MFEKVLRTAALAALMMAGAITSASARHRHHSSDAAPGEFDYYLLSLSWSPAFCLQSPGAAQCNGQRRYGFIVHGLWPQYEQGWPENCAVDTSVPNSVLQGITDLMPARSLVYHEWSAHGTCSGLDPADFFALVRRAYETVAIPAPFSRPGGAIEQSPSAIVAEFVQANPRLPLQSVIVTCGGQGAPRLREVHVCFNRELTPRACSADAVREACRATKVIVPPIR